MKVEVGQVWEDITGWKDIILIIHVDEKDSSVVFDVIQDPKRAWGTVPIKMLPITNLVNTYKHLSGYGTPLWKALNNLK